MSYEPGQIVVEFTNVSLNNETLQNQVYNTVSAESGYNISVMDRSNVITGLDLIKISKLNSNISYDNLTYIEELFREQTGVLYAELNYISKEDAIPDDTYYSKLWGLNNINAPNAWNITTGSKNVIVAVMDTGVDINNPDLSANIWTNPNLNESDKHGWNFVDNNNNVTDTNGHGTHCAGVIGAVGDNNLGVTGVAWDIKILPIKLFSKNGVTTDYEDAQAFAYATGEGASVISCSFGAPAYSKIVSNAIAKSTAIVICAAGNEGVNNDLTPSYPASYNLNNTISVAAINNTNQLPYFSNYGEKTVDLAAPGDDILSTYPEGVIPEKSEQFVVDDGVRYVYLSGTSMAAPYVSGVAALIKSVNPALTNVEIKNIILKSVDSLSSLKGKVLTGGKLDAYNAVLMAENTLPNGTASAPPISTIGDISGNSTNGVVPTLNASEITTPNAVTTTVPMQNTGAPLIPLALGALYMLAGLVSIRRK